MLGHRAYRLRLAIVMRTTWLVSQLQVQLPGSKSRGMAMSSDVDRPPTARSSRLGRNEMSTWRLAIPGQKICQLYVVIVIVWIPGPVRI